MYERSVIRTNEHGFSLIEMMIVLCLTAIIASMAVVQIGSSRPLMQADGAMRQVMGTLNAARETAVAQRRNVQVTFIGTNTIRLTRIEVPASAGTTVLRELTLEGGLEFATPPSDTPDAFGAAGGYPTGTVIFSSDGMLITNTGAPINGSVFVSKPSMNQTFRGITILGSTGRVRGWKWNGTTWTQV